MIPLLLLIVLFISLALCFACNKDVFSPSKFYHASLAVYFLDIFLSVHSGYVYATYGAFIGAGLFISILEAYILSRKPVLLPRPRPSFLLPVRFVVVLWILSAVPILSQCYLIYVTGGLASLALTISHRVVEWRGMGFLLMLIRFMSPINLVYFAVGLVYVKRHARFWWCLYALHLLLFLIMAVLLGGRGFVLMQVILMMALHNYLVRPVRLRYTLVAGGILLTTASVLGSVRNNVTRLESFNSLADMKGGAFNLDMFSYGTNPLEVIFTKEFSDFQYGKTFLTPVTNLVPRRIWPGKFDSGGVVLTKFWLGHEYNGLSNMSTGIVAEGILNFGYSCGILCAFMLLLGAILLSVRFYGYVLRHIGASRELHQICLAILYINFAEVPGGLLRGEFQNNICGLILRLVPVLTVLSALRLRLFPDHDILKGERGLSGARAKSCGFAC